MTKTKSVYRISKAELEGLRPCKLERRLALFGRKKYLTAQAAFDAGVTVSDFMWVLCKTGHQWVAVKMALKYAESVAALNPDERVQAAIDAAWKVVADPSDVNSRAAARAAADAAYAAAYAAADAAYAAADAADAAYAAADAAYAAAYAAYAAADAAYAAAYAAYAGQAPLRWIDVFNEVVGHA